MSRRYSMSLDLCTLSKFAHSPSPKCLATCFKKITKFLEAFKGIISIISYTILCLAYHTGISSNKQCHPHNYITYASAPANLPSMAHHTTLLLLEYHTPIASSISKTCFCDSILFFVFL